MALTGAHSSFVAQARTATLGTIAEDGRPRLVPICFVLDDDVLFTPIDEKPKRGTDPRQLARIRDIERRAEVTVLVDRWNEDWTNLAGSGSTVAQALPRILPNARGPSRRSARSTRNTRATTLNTAR